MSEITQAEIDEIERDAIIVEPDHYSWRSMGRTFRELLDEMLAIQSKDGAVEFRVTTTEDGLVWVEGWDRKLVWPYRQAPFNPPYTLDTEKIQREGKE